MPTTFTIADPEDTRAFGARLARLLRPGDVVLLHGDLGGGKTTLTQGIARGLGITEPIQSPTFTLVAEHHGMAPDGKAMHPYHLDLYRLGGVDDLETIGFDDLIAPLDGMSVIEWLERAGGWLPDRYLLVTIVPVPEGGRFGQAVESAGWGALRLSAGCPTSLMPMGAKSTLPPAVGRGAGLCVVHIERGSYYAAEYTQERHRRRAMSRGQEFVPAP